MAKHGLEALLDKLAYAEDLDDVDVQASIRFYADETDGEYDDFE